jgi:hypothetical protein
MRESAGGLAQVDIETAYGAPSRPRVFTARYQYAIDGSGGVKLTTRVVPSPGLPNLPRLGLSMALPGQFDRFSWHGLGPHDTYSDRRESGRVGVYSGLVSDQYVPYIRPQEYGNKIDVRWAAVTDAFGRGLIVRGQDLLNVSAHRHALADLTAARHTHELPTIDQTAFYVDKAQCGLGSQSCGPGPLERYLLPASETEFTIVIEPTSTDSTG